MNLPTIIQLPVLFAGSLLATTTGIYLLLKTPIARHFIDNPDQRKVHKKPIPRLGGVVIVMSTMLFLSISLFFDSPLMKMSENTTPLIYAILFASGVILITGFFDDTTFFTVRVRHKITAQIAVAFIAVYILDINIGKLSILNLVTFPRWFSNIVSFLWIFGLSNAFNLIDGLDGLAGSISFIALITLAVIAGLGGQASVVIVCVIAAGSLIGFLVHNMPPAKTFMGDTGSLFLGTLIAILSLYVGREVTQERSFLVMPLIAGIPIIEVFITMVRRYFRAKDRKAKRTSCIHSMVIPDNSHIHHRLMYKGYSSFQVTTLLAFLSLILSIGAICSVLIPTITIPILLLYIFSPLVLTLDNLGFGGRFKKALHISPTRYNGFRKKSLVAVIDSNGSVQQLLDQKKCRGITYITTSEEQMECLSPFLHSAVVCNEKENNISNILQKAETYSFLLSRPVFVIEKNSSTDLYVKEVSKNGSLVIREKKSTIKELVQDLERVSLTQKIKHHDSESMNLIESDHFSSVC